MQFKLQRPQSFPGTQPCPSICMLLGLHLCFYSSWGHAQKIIKICLHLTTTRKQEQNYSPDAIFVHYNSFEAIITYYNSFEVYFYEVFSGAGLWDSWGDDHLLSHMDNYTSSKFMPCAFSWIINSGWHRLFLMWFLHSWGPEKCPTMEWLSHSSDETAAELISLRTPCGSLPQAQMQDRRHKATFSFSPAHR